MAEPSTSRRDLRTIGTAALVGALVVYSFVTFWTNVVPTRRVVAATESRLRDLERENAAHEHVLAAIEQQCRLLHDDPWTVERAVRDELRMSRPGELLVR